MLHSGPACLRPIKDRRVTRYVTAGDDLACLNQPCMGTKLAVFGLLDVDEEFFVIVRPAPAGTRLLLSDATAALDYDIAAEVLDKLDSDIDDEDLEDEDPFEEGDLGVLADIGLPAGVLGVIIADDEMEIDEQIAAIAERMGFDSELSSVLDKLGR